MTAEAENAADIRDNLIKSRIGGDLLKKIRQNGVDDGHPEREGRLNVIIEFNRDFPGGTEVARRVFFTAYERISKSGWLTPYITRAPNTLLSLGMKDTELNKLRDILAHGGQVSEKSLWTDMYAFACLNIQEIKNLAAWCPHISGKSSLGRNAQTSDASKQKIVPLVYKIWDDPEIERCVFESVRTIKCDAARAAFAAAGKDIVWAVADSGIDERHPHFKTFNTLELPNGLLHKDFTVTDASDPGDPLTDTDGHGTHVAGIIAGLTSLHPAPLPAELTKMFVSRKQLKNDMTTEEEPEELDEVVSGMAPKCKLISLKVLEKSNRGQVSNLIAALNYILRRNDYGRHIQIHGVNLSLGYNFDATSFAAGQSPLCVEVDRLVRSGVCVVVAAGNNGYGTVAQYSGGIERATHLGTITDPGNAALAVTVGSTHRDMPHSFGVSYFSSKGPTADGRMKPDVVAPGERIVSCAPVDPLEPHEAKFREDSGTSMAAPHVSGALAAFLSVRREFIGQPERLKTIFINSATDIGRRPEFQGAGLLDLMRALQSV